MKNIIIILLFISVSAMAQIKPKAELSYMPNGYNLQGYFYDYRFGNFRSRIGIDFIWEDITLSFDNHVYMQYAGFRFAPIRTDYLMRIDYKLSKEIKIGIEHLCIHPVVNNKIPLQEIAGGYTSIMISYGY